MSGTKEKTRKKGKLMWGLIYVLAFVIAFGAGAASKAAGNSMGSAYEMRWDDSLGSIQTDLPYGEGPTNKFDLYLPADSTKETYGLAVYLHAGGFTSGDKADDQNMLSWLCAKGYVAAGINYTLRTEENTASVLKPVKRNQGGYPPGDCSSREGRIPH